jgi:hypothetical protein
MDQEPAKILLIEDLITMPLTLRDARAIYKLIEHDWISYENFEAHEAIRKIMRFIENGKWSTG